MNQKMNPNSDDKNFRESKFVPAHNIKVGDVLVSRYLGDVWLRTVRVAGLRKGRRNHIEVVIWTDHRPDQEIHAYNSELEIVVA